ncbi:hypothetical protein DdX_08267 [Ditylenchus destructor]|uniref:p-granule-associated protein DEPS-1 second OB-fold domain-containing protein n=1 Tax=Ditylenchus destructor TaxID=166010 RepID=A0AAD4N8F6_9BILA|nr:hypothetical protein DdX_08267 [Ditylenchus destructor]
MAQNPNSGWRTGVIACANISRNIAGIVFCDHRQPLYILPKELFQPTKKDLKTLSKNQINKICTPPGYGVNVTFKADDNRVITQWAKTSHYIDCKFSEEDCMQIITPCVISAEHIRRCWSHLFGVLAIENQRKIRDYMPNVAYRCGINVWIDFHETRIGEDNFISLDSFHPTYICTFSDVKDVYLDDTRETFVRSAPWNRHIPIIIRAADYEEDNVEFIGMPPIDEREGHKTAVCLVVNPRKNLLFCVTFPDEECKLAKYSHNIAMYKPGLLINVDMFPCKHNKCNIIYRYWRNSFSDPLPHDFDTNGDIILLLSVVELDKTNPVYSDIDERKRYFWSGIATLIDDPQNLMPTLNEPEEVWVKYKGASSTPEKFSIVKLGFLLQKKMNNNN